MYMLLTHYMMNLSAVHINTLHQEPLCCTCRQYTTWGTSLLYMLSIHYMRNLSAVHINTLHEEPLCYTCCQYTTWGTSLLYMLSIHYMRNLSAIHVVNTLHEEPLCCTCCQYTLVPWRRYSSPKALGTRIIIASHALNRLLFAPDGFLQAPEVQADIKETGDPRFPSRRSFLSHSPQKWTQD